MDIKAEGKYLKIAARKVRLIVSAVKVLSIDNCIDQLSGMRKRGAGFILTVLKSALANAKNNLNVDSELLFIKDIQVKEGSRLKRLDKSHGARFDRGIRKKSTCHIEVILGVREKPDAGSKGVKEKSEDRKEGKKILPRLAKKQLKNKLRGQGKNGKKS